MLDEVPAKLMADQTLGGTVTNIGWTEDGEEIDVRVRTTVDKTNCCWLVTVSAGYC